MDGTGVHLSNALELFLGNEAGALTRPLAAR